MTHRFQAQSIITVSLALLVCAAPAARQMEAQNRSDNIGSPKFGAEPPGSTVQHQATTIPNWTSSFTYSGAAYAFTMVGTDPAAGAAATTVPVVIVPLNFVFSNGVNLDGASKLTLTTQSPIFQAAAFDSGKTQFGDAMQRATFWNYAGTKAAPNWHVLLGQPAIAPEQTLVVPQDQGSEFTGSVSGAPIGLVEYQWFSTHIQNLLGSMHISANTIPIFLTYNVFLYQKSTANCCIIGYHGATASAGGNGVQQVQTYIWASYSDPGIFSVPIEDINALSHEVAEWLNDPLVGNVVPAWSVPSEPQYGCSNVLEVGDPLVGVAYKVNLNGTAYHPQDVAFLPWFARSASASIGGRYTYLGTFTTYSPGCN